MIRRRMHSTLAWKQYCRFTVIAPWLGSHQCSDPPRWERRNAASFPARLLSYLLPFLLPHSISKRFPTFHGIIFNDKTLPPFLRRRCEALRLLHREIPSRSKAAELTALTSCFPFLQIISSYFAILNSFSFLSLSLLPKRNNASTKLSLISYIERGLISRI